MRAGKPLVSKPRTSIGLQVSKPRSTSKLQAGFVSGVQQVQRREVKSRRETGFPPAVRLAIRVRAGNGDIDQAACEACNCWLGRYGGQIQHIVARGMGGSRRRNKITDGCLLCGTPRTGCHGLCESRDPHMRAMGFWRKSTDPRIPLMLHGEQSGVLVWLTPEGGYRTARPGEEAA